jgi:hypothetical protein
VTTRQGNVIVIEPTLPAACEYCKQVRELRPYGKNGESICFECGMLDEPTTKTRMDKQLFGEVDS